MTSDEYAGLRIVSRGLVLSRGALSHQTMLLPAARGTICKTGTDRDASLMVTISNGYRSTPLLDKLRILDDGASAVPDAGTTPRRCQWVPRRGASTAGRAQAGPHPAADASRCHAPFDHTPAKESNVIHLTPVTNRAADDTFDEGMEHWWAGDRRRAVKSFRRALELDPQHADVHNHLGIVSLEARKLNAAEQRVSRTNGCFRSAAGKRAASRAVG